MTLELAELVDPAHTALVTNEIQNGVIGPSAPFAQLGEVARVEAIPNIARLVRGARAGGIQVIHGVAWTRANGRADSTNSSFFLMARQLGLSMEPGSSEAALLDEIGPEPEDIVVGRYYGLNPMVDTEVDRILRNLGVTTIVVTGVSVAVAITGLVMEALNRGYTVVMPQDAVAGFPKEYADSIIENTLSRLATVTTTDALLEAWGK